MFHTDENAKVAPNERLVSVESMKMNFDAVAPCHGLVRYKCQLGEHVYKYQVVAEVV